MLWFLLLALAILTLLGGVILVVLGVRSLAPRDGGEPAQQGTAKTAYGVALLLIGAIFLLQGSCIVVAFITSRLQLGANPWG